MVERAVGFVGEVTVFWEVAVEGRQDLEPSSGNLTFQEVQSKLTVHIISIIGANQRCIFCRM